MLRPPLGNASIYAGMSAQREKGGVVPRPVARKSQEEIEALEALRFAKAPSSVPNLPATAVVDTDAKALKALDAETQRLARLEREAQRLAAKREFKTLAILAQSTIPPAIISEPPPAIPRAPAASAIEYVAPDRTVPMPAIAPSVAAAITASRDSAVGRRSWALLISIAAIALPASLLFGLALVPPTRTRSPRPAAFASTSRVTESMSATPPSEPSFAPPIPSLNPIWDPVEPSIIVRAPRSHRKDKSAPKSAPSAAASSVGAGDERSPPIEK
jgi:hypothetical protein